MFAVVCQRQVYTYNLIHWREGIPLKLSIENEFGHSVHI